MNDTQATEQRKGRRLLWFFGIVMVLVLLAAFVVVQSRRDYPIEISYETTRVTEPVGPDGLIDFAAAFNAPREASISPEENAYVALLPIIGPKTLPWNDAAWMERHCQSLGIEVPAAHEPAFVSFETYAEQGGSERKEASKILDVILDRPWSAEEFPEASAWLEAMESPLDAVVEAVERPKFFVPVHAESGKLFYAVLPPVSASRDLFRGLHARANMRLAQGDISGAWGDTVAMTRFSAHTSHWGESLAVLVAYAFESASRKTAENCLVAEGVSTAMIAGFQRDLAERPSFRELADALDELERYAFIDFIQYTSHDVDELQSFLSMSSRGVGDEWRDALARIATSGVNWNVVLKRINRVYDEAVAILEMSDIARQDVAIAKFDADMAAYHAVMDDPNVIASATVGLSGAREDLLTAMVFYVVNPRLSRPVASQRRNLASQSAFDTALAVVLYQRTHGRLPKDLSELVPDYLPEVPSDPFNAGKPLQYRTSDTGFIVYSVGENGVDEDGRDQNGEPRGDDLATRISLPQPPE